MPDDEKKTFNKVESLLEAYDLDESLGDALEAYWTGEGRERRSLRELANSFNRRLLEAAMDEAGESPLAEEVSHYYRTLTDDDASIGERTEVENRLERIGVDVDAVRSDFVTYQAIRSYLKTVRGVEYQRRSDEDRDQTAIEGVQKLQSRLEMVTESNLNQLMNRGAVTVGDHRISADVSVYCEDCGRRYAFNELVENGGCECSNALET